MCAAAIRIDYWNLKLFGVQVSLKLAAYDCINRALVLNFMKSMEVSGQLIEVRFFMNNVPKLGCIEQKGI